MGCIILPTQTSCTIEGSKIHQIYHTLANWYFVLCDPLNDSCVKQPLCSRAPSASAFVLWVTRVPKHILTRYLEHYRDKKLKPTAIYHRENGGWYPCLGWHP